MNSPVIILSGLTPEELAKVIQPMIREAIREELKAVLERQDEKLLSPSAACEKFVPKISKTTLSKWTDEGLIDAKKIGGKKFYLLSEIILKAAVIRKYKN